MRTLQNFICNKLIKCTNIIIELPEYQKTLNYPTNKYPNNIVTVSEASSEIYCYTEAFYILTQTQNKIFSENYNYIFDTTGNNLVNIQNLLLQNHDHNYITYIIFVNTSPKIALKRVKNRSIEEGRTVDTDYLLNVYQNVKPNFDFLRKFVKNRITYIQCDNIDDYKTECNIPQTGGYYQKYMEYKYKYLQLKKNL